MRAEIAVRLARPRREMVAPQQDLVGKIGELRAGLRIDEIARPGNREVEAEFLAAGPRDDVARLVMRFDPRRGEMQVEIREAQHPLDRVARRGRAGATEADRLMPAYRVRQLGVVVVGAGIAAHSGNRDRGVLGRRANR